MRRPFLTNVKNEKKFLVKFAKYYLVIFAVFLSFLFGLFTGQRGFMVKDSLMINSSEGKVYNKASVDYLSKDVNFDLFWNAWNIIERNYVHQPVSETQMLYGALAGSVASLADPHSTFFDPQTTQEFTNELKGTFDGIGAELAIKNNNLTIIAPLPDSPAEKAGLRSGDKIYAIDGEDTSAMSLDYAVSKIRGQKGTEVALTISRDGEAESQEVKIVRQAIKIESVKWKFLNNNIAYIELRYFNEDTKDVFNKAILNIIAKNPKGIILDLRNDPGGFLDKAIAVASEWVEDGVVVYEKSSDGKLKENKASGRARLKDFKTVVLINKGSASASEIVAGALQDYGLATIVGENSFGKGTVQTLFPLDDGSSIKLTIAEWLTPHQNTIEKDGIAPDIKVELTDDDFNKNLDPQLDKAVELLK